MRASVLYWKKWFLNDRILGIVDKQMEETILGRSLLDGHVLPTLETPWRQVSVPEKQKKNILQFGFSQSQLHVPS